MAAMPNTWLQTKILFTKYPTNLQMKKQHLSYALELWVIVHCGLPIWKMDKYWPSQVLAHHADIREFLKLASKIPILPDFQVYSLTEANVALRDIKKRKIKGAKVLKVD